ncbi:2,3-diaminopropionate biosynthesis protein SbnB [Flavobacterium tructae]|uniref:2,3-diaminopropionate biosynthesis protein SbnB n=1 Tax=Flavobacterium tructae TaxID=1114873 RepID=UPI002551DB97|nr:2,3-diaminopropionate biosynthesis protein SbnB [Flavobacterium tructae]MDL2144701.1 2,3-diaminopropionate biosynthesis protein SbnB [Flavobacterium tructae]
MKYINEQNILEIGNNWNEIIQVIEDTVLLLEKKDYAQPIKPYLRYKDLKNRIIAMPAYVGGDYNISGIKWIASFPDNIKNNLPRANSVIILNNADTGVPISVINTPMVSAIRTSAVTGAIIKSYREAVEIKEKINFGIIGLGPIGRMHLEMIFTLHEDIIDKIYVYDINPIDTELLPEKWKHKIVLANDWEQAYLNSKIFITCTASSKRYINLPPPKGSLQLNVSLRDYEADVYDYIDCVIVDNWDEVCRENTDIEMMHQTKGLLEKDVLIITDVLSGKLRKTIKANDTIMFCPMGMAIFDIGIAKYFYELSQDKRIGQTL